MSDPTESTRRQMVQEINAAPGSREYLEAKHGQVCRLYYGFKQD